MASPRLCVLRRPWVSLWRAVPTQSRRRVVSPCARAVIMSRSRMAVNIDRTWGIARFSLSATGRWTYRDVAPIDG
jgi:hypothetical protein